MSPEALFIQFKIHLQPSIYSHGSWTQSGAKSDVQVGLALEEKSVD